MGKVSRKGIVVGLAICIMALAGWYAEVKACDVLVVSARVTTNGRPILWKNRDCSANWHQEIKYFDPIDAQHTWPGGPGGYSMVYNYDDVAELNNGTPVNPSGGVNQAGFAISCTSVYEDFNPIHEAFNINTDLIRHSLQECVTIEDFEYWLREAWYARHAGQVISGNFGVIDAYGGCALYECYTGQIAGSIRYRKYDANDGRITEYAFGEETVIDEGEGDAFIGFFVRANNNYYININYGDERMVRARELMTGLINEGRCNYKTVMREVSKDVIGIQKDADPESPTYGQIIPEEEANYERYSTTYCISRNQTRLGMVVDGVAAGDDPRLSTFWCALGEPSLAVYIPYFAHAAGVHDLCWVDHIGLDGYKWDINDTCLLDRICNRVEIMDDLIYKSNTGDVATGMKNRLVNRVELRRAQQWTFALEDVVFDETEDVINDLLADSSRITPRNLLGYSNYCVQYVYDNFYDARSDVVSWEYEKPW